MKPLNMKLPSIVTINEQLEAEILTRSSNEAKTSHAVAANLSELELKKILIDKIENTITIKRRQDDQDEDEEPSARSNRGSKRRRARKEPELTSAPKEKTSKSLGKSKEGSTNSNHTLRQSYSSRGTIHADEDGKNPHIGVDTIINVTLPDALGPIQPGILHSLGLEDTRDLVLELSNFRDDERESLIGFKKALVILWNLLFNMDSARDVYSSSESCFYKLLDCQMA
ncbi:hypothetical protein Tco_0109274 [Tanacetum coccineum]